MRGVVNDYLRRLIALGIECLGLVLTIVQRARARLFFWSQKRLTRRYGITSDTPILTFGPEQEQLIERAAARAERGARFACTSGSTAKPKRILYTRRRLRKVKLAYVDFFARCCWSLGIKRSSLYVFSAVSKDGCKTTHSPQCCWRRKACRVTFLRCRRRIAFIAIRLYSQWSPLTEQQPYAVPCNSAARAVHLLSGVGGWCHPFGRPGSVSMIVRLHYADGKTEDHPLKNGEHMADYIRVVEVPDRNSRSGWRQQVRYLSIAPKRTDVIANIEFVKGEDDTAPVVMAVTAEMP